MATVYTFQDAIDRMVDFLGGNAQAAAQRDIRRAIIAAYDEITISRNWTYLNTYGRIELNAPYSTGTITYTDATRTLALAGGTWPSWAANGTVRIANVNYRVQSIVSATVLILDPVVKPVADIAALTEYEIFQQIYTLPGDFRRMKAPHEEGTGWWSQFIDPETWLLMDRYSQGAGQTIAWTVMGDPRYLGQQALHLFPPPDTNRTLDFIYQRFARTLKYTGYGAKDRATTSMSLASTGTAITGTSTSFATDMAGSMLRVSPNSDVTNCPEGIGGIYPYQEQRTIVSAGSATTGSIETRLSTAASGVKFTISDPLDLDPIMIPAFWALCARKLCEFKSLPNLVQVAGTYEMAYTKACGADSKSFARRNAYEAWPSTSRRLARMPLGADY